MAHDSTDPYANTGGAMWASRQPWMPAIFRRLASIPGRRLGLPGAGRDDQPVMNGGQPAAPADDDHMGRLGADGMIHLDATTGAEAAGRLLRRFRERPLLQQAFFVVVAGTAGMLALGIAAGIAGPGAAWLLVAGGSAVMTSVAVRREQHRTDAERIARIQARQAAERGPAGEEADAPDVAGPGVDGVDSPEVATPETPDTPDTPETPGNAEVPAIPPVTEADGAPAATETPDSATSVVDAGEPAASEAVEIAAPADAESADVADPTAISAEAPVAARDPRHPLRGLTGEALHAERSRIQRDTFWRLQTDQAKAYRDALDMISVSPDAADARELALSALLVRESDGLRCRENIAYRSLLEQVRDLAAGGGRITSIRTAARDALRIYTPELSVATTGAAPTETQVAEIAHNAAGVRGAVARRSPAVQRLTVVPEGRPAAEAGPAPDPGPAPDAAPRPTAAPSVSNSGPEISL